MLIQLEFVSSIELWWRWCLLYKSTVVINVVSLSSELNLCLLCFR